MKEIKLSQQGKNRGRFVALVDDEDYEYLNQFYWYVSHGRNTSYAARLTDHTILMHREILNPDIKLVIDHIDQDGLNNQKSNLRQCTQYQNKLNRIIKCACGYLGVHINNEGYISARIQVNGKGKHLGYFKTIEDAARCRDEAAKKYYGEFATLNFK